MYLKKTQITNNFPEYGHECYCEDGADAQNWIVKYDVFFSSLKKKAMKCAQSLMLHALLH